MSILDDLSNELHNTPPGKSEWAKILQPDYKYDKDGLYSIDHYVDSAPAEKIIEVIRAIAGMKTSQEGATSYAPPPFTIDKETGIHCFKYRQSAIGRPKVGEPFEIKVDVFDAKMNAWPKDILIGNGSIVKVCFSLYPWNVVARGGVGITLRLKAVQILDHVAYEAEERTYGFQEEDGVDIGSQSGFGAEAGNNQGASTENSKQESANPYDNKPAAAKVEDDIPF